MTDKMDPVTMERIRRSMRKGFWRSPGAILLSISTVGLLLWMAAPFLYIEVAPIGDGKAMLDTYLIRGYRLISLYVAISVCTLVLAISYWYPSRTALILSMASFPLTVLATLLNLLLIIRGYGDPLHVHVQYMYETYLFLFDEALGLIGTVLLLLRYNRILKRETDPRTS